MQIEDLAAKILAAISTQGPGIEIRINGEVVSAVTLIPAGNGSPAYINIESE